MADATLLANDAAGLERELGRWLLLGRPVSAEAEAWSFRTHSAAPNVQQIGSSHVLLRPDDVLLGCRKRAGGTSFRSTILVGRAASNDVMIAHPSVSKLHARLELGDTGGTISDADSSNGTCLDDERLPPNEQRPVTLGSVLTFGSCSFVLASVAHLQRVLLSSVR